MPIIDFEPARNRTRVELENLQSDFDEGCVFTDEDVNTELKVCTLQVLVTAVMLPTGAVEVAVNNKGLKAKVTYILSAYDEEMRLKTNPAIQMVGVMFA